MFKKDGISSEDGIRRLGKCANCGGGDFIFLFKGHDYSRFRPYDFSLMKCRQCGMIYTDPQPKKDYLYVQADCHDTQSKGVDIFLKPLSPDRRRIVEKLKKGGRILDVGCGVGEFLSDMKVRGWEVYGNDLSADLCDRAKNKFGLQNIYNNDLLALDFPDNFFDIVTLWHVFEHLEYPVESLKKIKKILKNNGILIIESPDYASWQRKFFKGSWFALGVPSHVHQYCPHSLAGLLKSAGLEIFAKDYLVNLRIDFITFKRSILRALHLELVPDDKGNNESLVLTGLKRYRFIYMLLRISFEAACLVIAFILALINCGSTFRVYCRKDL